MTSIFEVKEQPIAETPLILFDCVLASGNEERWSSHKVQWQGRTYQARVLRHNLFEMRAASEDGIDSISKISITLANADSYFSQITQAANWKGAKVTATFVFFNLKEGIPASEGLVLFRGMANAPEEMTESTIRLSITNRLNLQRLLLPEIRIQRRCPWMFPSTSQQREEAAGGGSVGNYSGFRRCGYSPDQTGGLGSLNGPTPFDSCDYTRSSCQQRGMFSEDSQGRVTRRFGGIEFVPASILVRGHGERSARLSTPVDNQARYNDFVPLVYGTVWINPPVVFARNDGNMTRMEVLLGAGEIHRVLKVVVNDVDIPLGVVNASMTATGWYNVVSHGTLTGGFNLDFADSAGRPLGDPYGSMAYVSVVVPNRVSDGRILPRVGVLLEGLRLPQFELDGGYLGESFTNNPAWVILDLLRRSGWTLEELDPASFARAASYCAQAIPALDLYGNPTLIPRYQCNLAIRRRTSASDVIRGIRNGSGMYLTYGSTGLLELKVEGTLATQQPAKPAGSNAREQLNSGWPAYEFGDGTNGFSGILRTQNGESSVRIWSRSTPETANRYSLEFQDEFNEYQQDSLSLVDVEDAVRVGQEVSATFHALGVANFHQAARILRRHLDKSIRGNLYIELATSVRAVHLRPGDIITVTYLKEGLQRRPFRIIRISPSLNHREAIIEAQIHDNSWYSDTPEAATGGVVSRRQPSSEVGLPRPLVGRERDEHGEQRLTLQESYETDADGGVTVMVAAGFSPPAKPAQTGIGIPYLSLAAAIETTGGTIPGGQILYYAVSAVDSAGVESDLSFVVPAVIPSGSATKKVTLQSLSFSPGTAAFHVYRGANPQQLLRIASDISVSTSFSDSGLEAMLVGPPDENFDHAIFEWRLELHPETATTSASQTTIGNSALQLAPNEYRGMVVRIVSGKGRGQERVIESHDANTLNIRSKWDSTPDITSRFVIAEASWRSGAGGSTSPVRFEIPNREGATIHVVGRAMNVHGRQSGYEMGLLTRWRIGGASGVLGDQDVPPPPVYGLFPTGQGTIELLAIGFSQLENTRTIQAGTLTLHYWNELASPTLASLGNPVDESATLFTLASPGPGQPGDLIQIDAEIMEVEEVAAGGAQYTLRRGSHGSTPAAHGGGSPIYHLQRKVYVIPFSRDFFGSPASGSFSYPIFIPDVRVAAADFFVTNSRGNSETSKVSVAATVDRGLRTLSGGQLTIQVEGYLAIQTGAAPPLVIEDPHSVRDVFAVVREAPTGAPIQLELRQDGEVYCNLTIPIGSTISNIVNGFALPPLRAMSKLTLNITSVGQTAETTPGRDLTVTIRL